MQNETVLLAPKIGTTDAASSEVQPITSAEVRRRRVHLPDRGDRVGRVASGVDALQPSLWPSTPPALLIALVAASHETRYVGPSAASGPVNGATSATVSCEPAAVAAEPPDERARGDRERPPRATPGRDEAARARRRARL